VQKSINFKQYTNDSKYPFYELPKFLVDTSEEKYNKTNFNEKLLYFFMYYLSDLSEVYNESLYFKVTIREIQEILDVSENTAIKYKNELINKGLIFEIPSRGRIAARYAINKNLDLKNEESTYIDENGNKRFSFIEVPDFLFHSYFSELKTKDKFVYSVLRNCMKIPINAATKGDRTFVTRGGRIFCLLSDEDIQSFLRLSKKDVRNAKNRLCEVKLLREEISNNDKNGYIQNIISEPMTLPETDIEKVQDYNYIKS